MKVKSLTLNRSGYPSQLGQIHRPPAVLYYAGAEPSNWLDKPKVAIVGSRKISRYGLEVTDQLASQLAAVGVVIISGLAYGIDAAAHQYALKAGGFCVAVLPTAIESIYPPGHGNLANQIIEQSGSLISEYHPSRDVFRSNFIDRNRIISGLADVVIIVEAAVRSGAISTANFALEQGKTVMAVPGNINSITSEGCNNLIKSGALPVTNVEDVFFALGLKQIHLKRSLIFAGSEEEQTIFELIQNGTSNQEELAVKSSRGGAEINNILTTLELGGYIKPLGAGHWIPSR